VLIGRWAWLDARVLVEEHQDGKCLVRVGTHLRPTALGITAAVALGTLLTVAASAGAAYRWPTAGVAAAALTLALGAFTAARTARAAATVRQGLGRVADALGLVPLGRQPARPPLLAPSLPRTFGLRTAAVFVLMIVSLGASTFLLRDAAIARVMEFGPRMSAWLDTPGGLAVGPDGNLYLADAHAAAIRVIDGATLTSAPFAGSPDGNAGFSGDGGPALGARLSEPDGLAFAPDGDLVFADSENHRIRRIDRATGVITTIAGSGAAGWNGDGLPALATALDQPSAVAVAPNGDVYIADAMNNRVRRLDHATGLIETVAGNGRVDEDGARVGDGGPATSARLFMPSDVALAPNGDLYIADTHHNRIRVVDAATGRIRTVAGSGAFGRAPDEVEAIRGALSTPTGIALVATEGGTTLFIADSYNAVVRMVGPDGVMHTLDSGETLLAPARVAYAPASGWLYVTDAADDKLVALSVPGMRPARPEGAR
jgi:DNA-binding beta-propeller fold protein YncE